MVGTVFEEIILKNEGDMFRVRDGHLKETEVRQTAVQSIVDTGAATLIINEAVQKELGLRIDRLKESRLANGEGVICKVAETVRVCWKDRTMTCEPWVVPGADHILLGAIPLEDMDLIVDPKNLKLVGAHGDKELGMLF